MKHTHRNVEFDVHQLDDGRWEWIAYPKIGKGDRFAGALEDDENKATAAATAAIDARLGPLPDPSQWSGTSNWDPSVARQRNTAFLDSGGSQVFPPPPQTVSQVPPANSAATVDTPAGAIAGTAPGEIKAPEAHSGGAALPGAGSMAVNGDVLRAERRVITKITQNLAADPSENRATAQALLQATQTKIAELRDARLNDPKTAELIDFLEWLARGLTELIENLDRAIANPSEPMFLGTAGKIAHQLKIGLLEAVEKNRVRVWEIGALVGVGCFLASLSGEKLSDILNALFNRK